MTRIFFMLGALLGFTGVALGAFAAHGLKDKLDADLLTIFEVGVRYQMVHALALLAAAWAATRFPGGAANAAGWCFVFGTLIFSGSLYILALSGIRWLGAITPIGGVLYLIGWAALFYAAWRAE
ncbi:MAG: DUF423 domain-containing protein [bacterium]|nr:DUF423 domain-containing protein [bacterium]